MRFSAARGALIAGIGSLVLLGAVGQDTRFNTLEDFWGVPSGESFQASLGFRLREGDPATGASGTSFGVAVDDMVIQWREYKLVGDATDCATSGSCATVELDASRIYEGNDLLAITVTDTSPYAMTAPGNVNDCNGNGLYVDSGVDDTDCDGDGIPDVTVRVTSGAEIAGELVVLNRIGSSDSYRGTLPLSTTTNIPGVLLLSPTTVETYGTQVTREDTITVRYDDRWDGTPSGSKCRNDPEPSRQGVVIATATVFIDAGSVVVRSFRVADLNGDQDGYPDTNETVDLYITIWNKSSQNLTNLVAHMSTSDPKIECVLSSIVTFGSIPAHGSAESPTGFRLKIHANADRSGSVPPVTCTSGTCSNGAGSCAVSSDCQKSLNDIYAATLTIAMSADQFDVIDRPQVVSLDLDLNSSNPVLDTTSFTEGFETGFGSFQFLNIDDNKASNSLSDGYRCQYNDPRYCYYYPPSSCEYCYLGFAQGQSPVNDWHLHSTAAPDGGRAFLGNNSMHYGKHTPENPNLDTTGLSQMDALRNKAGVHLAARVCHALQTGAVKSCNSSADCTSPPSACVSASPELSFKHQVSTIDGRSTNAPDSQAVDRAAVGAQIVGATLWQKLYPFENLYDVQGENVFSNCIFDPIDDGNNEDSFFDPTDPFRLFGPSTTCFPEFIWGYLGDTDQPFNPTNIGRASDGPGLQGSLGPGTWVQSRFDLSRLRGRSIRIRFLYTSIKGADAVSAEAFFMWNPRPDDDGWYIDDVRITQTLGASTPTVSLDTADGSGLPGCGSACNSLTASLSATPPSAPVPGRTVVVSAQDSTADRCVNGILLFQFWVDGDGNGNLGDPQDTMLRDFSTNPILEEAPLASTRYGVVVKCSSAPAPPPVTSCNRAQATVLVQVACPTSGGFRPDAWWSRVTFDADKTTLRWPSTHQSIDALRGDLATLRAGSFGGAICLQDDASGSSLMVPMTPPAGGGFYYLLRGASTSFCNDSTSWSTLHPQENPTNPGKRDAEITACSP